MSKTIVVLAEKKDVATDIAAALFGAAKDSEYRAKGYYSGEKDGDVWYVSNAVGHLLGLCEPEAYDARYAKWKLEDLPIYCPDWKLIPDQEGYKKKRLKVVEDLIDHADMLIAAGDPDDEGQFLIDELIDHFGFAGPIKRVLINDSMPANIRKEFAHLRENDDYRSLGKAAYARSMADKCFGINETRLAGLTLHRRGLSIGRVQTPTLGLIVARDETIEGHVKETYYEMGFDVFLDALKKQTGFQFKADSRYLKDTDSKLLKDPTLLTEIGNALKGRDVKITTTERDKVSNPPMPYTSTTLTAEMNKRYGYSMTRVLEITQSLRSKHAITYNRSKIAYLKEEHFLDAPDLFATILGGELVKKYGLDFTIHAGCFNDAQVKEHHGIIPQKNAIDVSALSEPERRVYLAICDRYAMQFLPPLKQRVSTSVFEIPYGTYIHTGEHTGYRTLDAGYTKHFKREKSEEEKEKTLFIPTGTYQGNVRDYHLETKETRPPAHYTEGTLISDMASIAKYVTDPKIKAILKKKDEGVKGENGSIGTVATRGVIIETLLKRGFIERKGKSLLSTRLGREFYHLLPESISKADTTARWWLIQEAIKDGTEPDVNAVQKAVIEEFLKHKDTAYKGAKLMEYEVKEKATGLFDGKEIRFNREWGGHRFSDEEVEALLAGREISFEYVSSAGKSMTANGKLEKQKYKGKEFYGFKLAERKLEPEVGYFIGYWVPGKREVKVKETWGGHTFTEQEQEDLLNGYEVTFDGVSAKGKEYRVRGKLANRTYKGKKFVGLETEFVNED